MEEQGRSYQKRLPIWPRRVVYRPATTSGILPFCVGLCLSLSDLVTLERRRSVQEGHREAVVCARDVHNELHRPPVRGLR